MHEDASDIFAAVAALKSLARGGAPHIITPMRKVRKVAQIAVLAEPGIAAPEIGELSGHTEKPATSWRRPVPPAPPTDDWTKDDLRNWRDRLGLRSQAEAASLLGMTRDGYSKLELGLSPVRLCYVRLCRYIEAYGPLP